MALRALDNSEHNRLFQRTGHVPFEEVRAANFEQQLAQFYEEYNTLMVKLGEVIANYREVAALINERQPLVKRKEPHLAFYREGQTCPALNYQRDMTALRAVPGSFGVSND